MIVKRVGPLSLGKLLGCLYAALGLILGGIFSLVALAGAAASGQQQGPAGLLFGLGVGAVIVIPILYGVLGFVGGVISAALYNLIASIVGGIELDLGDR